jgi:hypothetical protein
MAVDDRGHQNVLPCQLLLLDGRERAEPQPAWADKIHPGGEAGTPIPQGQRKGR